MALISFVCYLLFLVIYIQAVENDIQCGANEEYNECGSNCVETCTYKPQACIMICKEGCFCKSGYVRESNSTDSPCVTRLKCMINGNNGKCGMNEAYRECGPACVETCDFVPQMCTEQCVAGCFCKSDEYVRTNSSANSPCIQRKKCSE